LIFSVFVAVFPVEILKNVTALEILAVRASAVVSQLAYATDFDFASRFCNISQPCLVTRCATRASALSPFPAASAERATATNCILRHGESFSIEIELGNY
jgi:hypothetical protein